MKRIGLLIVILLMLSCKKQEGGVIIDTGIYLLYKNANGQNLLNSSVAGYIQSADIDVYVLRNGVKTRVFKGLMDNPENFRVTVSEDKGNLLNFFFTYDEGERVKNKVVMFIKYKDGNEDKLTGEFKDVKGPVVILEKVWVNDALMWERAPSGPSGIIEIIK